jgi:small subunit ribosomal protein S6
MENKRNSYETMFIVSLANGEEAAQATVAKFTNLIAANAEVVQIDDWGKRRMAYPIQDMMEGYYTVATYKCDGEFPAELERLMNIDESVIRSMNIKLEYDAAVKAAEKAAKAAAAAEAAATAEEAPAAEEAATDAE